MATAFTEKEKELIGRKLKEVAQVCLLKFGVKKTSVDEIVQMTGISKGSFYNFYPAKEILFFEVLEEYQKSVIDELENKLKKEEYIGTDKFTELFFGLFKTVRQSFVMNIIQNQEIEYLFRKLPKEIVAEHHSLDDAFTEKIFSYIKVRNNVKKEVIAASLRAIFMTMLHIDEINAKDFDEAMKLLIKGLAQQIIDEG